MKIAIISDIHGNLTALETVMPAIKAADRVVCLGDVASVGPQPHEVIGLLRDLRYPCVMGNTDESLCKNEPDDFGGTRSPKADLRRMRALDRWTRSEVTGPDKRYLSTFRRVITIRAGRDSLLCYHGSPRSNSEGLLATTSDEDLSRAFSGQKATVFAGGHTHSQMAKRWGGSVVINPGSVGLPYERDAAGVVKNPAWAEYAVVTLGEGGLSVELRRTVYELTRLARAVRKSRIPNHDWWLADWIQPRL